MPAFVDHAGKRFGRWTVIERRGSNRHGAPLWLCRCDCGTEKLVTAQLLVRGESRSCGCLNVDVHREVCVRRNTTHGQSRSPTYVTWGSMLQRCENPKTTAYPKYGGRGIKVCERWHSFENFLADMGERPAGHSIDRINPAGNYEPGNCRWLDDKGQQNNRRGNRKLTVNGETLGITEWERRTGLSRHTILARLRQGMSDQEALKTS